MPVWGPVSRRDLIAGLRALGYTGPHAGGNHGYMLKGTFKLAIPNPHSGVIGIGLLARILGQAGISKADWEAV